MEPSPPGQPRTVTGAGVAELLAPLRSEPSAAAVLCDLDGTLAPIVARPDEAAVPEEAQSVLRSLAGRYALVGIVSGRRAEDARAIAGIGELTYCGNHGFELLAPGASEAEPAPSLRGHEREAEAFVSSLEGGELRRLGFRVEDKGPIVALHWRGSPDEAEAEARAAEIAAEAERRGLRSHRGRKVLEIRPDVALDKGAAVESVLGGRGLRSALYGGDDRTDADAFRALRRLRESGELEAAAGVAVLSDEAPAELLEAADAAVDGTAGYLELLRSLL